MATATKSSTASKTTSTQSKSDFAKANGFSSSWASNPSTGKVTTTPSPASSPAKKTTPAKSSTGSKSSDPYSAYGGKDSYAKSQQNRYTEALKSGDKDLQGRLEADAKRAGYSLGGGTVSGNGYTTTQPATTGPTFLTAPKRSDYQNIQDFYNADNAYVKALVENPNNLPSDYGLAIPTAGVNRSNDVYGRQVVDNMLQYLGKDGNVVSQLFIPDLNWHQTGSGFDDREVGDVYSRNTSRYSAESIMKRGDQIGITPTSLNGVAYDGGKAHEQFMDDLTNKYSKAIQYFDTMTQNALPVAGYNTPTKDTPNTGVTSQVAKAVANPVNSAQVSNVNQQVAPQQINATVNGNLGGMFNVGIRDWGNSNGYDVGWDGSSPYLTKNGQKIAFGPNDFKEVNGRTYMTNTMANAILGENPVVAGTQDLTGVNDMGDYISKYAKLAKQNMGEYADEGMFTDYQKQKEQMALDTLNREYDSSMSDLSKQQWEEQEAQRQRMIANGIDDGGLVEAMANQVGRRYDTTRSEIGSKKLNAISDMESAGLDALMNYRQAMAGIMSNMYNQAMTLGQNEYKMNQDQNRWQSEQDWLRSPDNYNNKYMMSQIDMNNQNIKKGQLEMQYLPESLQLANQKAKMENQYYPALTQAQINNLNYHPPVGGRSSTDIGDLIKAQEYQNYLKQQSYLGSVDPKKFITANGNVTSLMNNLTADMQKKGGMDLETATKNVALMLQGKLGMPEGTLNSNANYTAWRNGLDFIPKAQAPKQTTSNYQKNMINNYNKTFGLMMR